MGKKKRAQRSKRRKQQRRRLKPQNITETVRVKTDNGVEHLITAGEQLPRGFFELLTHYFQRELRNSPLWDEMVEKYGEEEAEKLLKECRVKSGEDI